MKSYKQFINESKKMDINSICKRFNISNYTINKDGSIDVDGNVNFFNKSLTNIPLKFRNITGDFRLDHNKLTSLEGCPKSVGGDFGCSFNKLTSLEGCPESVGEFFECGSNQLTSLEGISEIVNTTIYCSYNKITDFKGISEYFDGRFYCGDNPIYEIYYLFNNDVNCIKWINEFDVIQDGDKVIMDRLEEVYHQLGMDIPENITFENYEII